eukprot:PhF_6_TR912/c0_g1_i2/m.1508
MEVIREPVDTTELSPFPTEKSAFLEQLWWSWTSPNVVVTHQSHKDPNSTNSSFSKVPVSRIPSFPGSTRQWAPAEVETLSHAVVDQYLVKSENLRASAEEGLTMLRYARNPVAQLNSVKSNVVPSHTPKFSNASLSPERSSGSFYLCSAAVKACMSGVQKHPSLGRNLVEQLQGCISITHVSNGTRTRICESFYFLSNELETAQAKMIIPEGCLNAGEKLEGVIRIYRPVCLKPEWFHDLYTAPNTTEIRKLDRLKSHTQELVTNKMTTYRQELGWRTFAFIPNVTKEVSFDGLYYTTHGCTDTSLGTLAQKPSYEQTLIPFDFKVSFDWSVANLTEIKKKKAAHKYLFCTHGKFRIPYCLRDSWINVLIVNVESLALSISMNRTDNTLFSKSKNMNLAVHVCLKTRDVAPNAEDALTAISVGGSPLMIEGKSSLTYDPQSSPIEFGDEFRVHLPAHLTSTHHLFFRIYNVSCNGEKKRPPSLIAFAVMRFFEEGEGTLLNLDSRRLSLIAADKFQAAISSGGGYIKSVSKFIQNSQNSVGTLTVRSVMVSSIYPHCDSVDTKRQGLLSILYKCNSKLSMEEFAVTRSASPDNDTSQRLQKLGAEHLTRSSGSFSPVSVTSDVTKLLDDLSNVPVSLLQEYFSVIASTLFRLMNRYPNSQTSSGAFIQLLWLMHRVVHPTPTDPKGIALDIQTGFLHVYIRDRFSNEVAKNEVISVADALMSSWLQVIKSPGASDIFTKLLIECNNAVCELIYKSLRLTHHANKSTKLPEGYTLLTLFCEGMSSWTVGLGAFSTTVNSNFSHFLIQCFDVVDPALVLTILQTHNTTLRAKCSPNIRESLMIEMCMKIVSCHHFSTIYVQATPMLHSLTIHNFLSPLHSLRNEFLDMVLKIASNHDKIEASSQDRERIAEMHIPWLEYFVTNWSDYKAAVTSKLNRLEMQFQNLKHKEDKQLTAELGLEKVHVHEEMQKNSRSAVVDYSESVSHYVKT